MNGEPSTGLLLIRSVNHMLTLLTALLSAALCWMVFRYPDDSLLLVTAAMLCAGACYDIQNCHDRFHVIFLSMLGAALFQFLNGVLLHGKFLILIANGLLVYIMFRTIKSRKAASIAAVVGVLSLVQPPGFHGAASRTIEMIFSALAAFGATMFVPLVHVKGDYAPAWDGGFSADEALRVTAAVLVGEYVFLAMKLPEGVWIPATVVFLYTAKTADNDLRPLAFLRLWGTILGMYAGFLFLGCLTYFNDLLIYLLPLVGAVAFFILYFFKSYLFYSMCFMMAFCLYADFNTAQWSNVHLLQLTSSRIVCTALGVLLTACFEMWFLPSPRKETPA